MRRFTTPTLPLSVPVDLTGADVRVSIKQGQRKLLKQDDDIIGLTYDSETGKTSFSVRLSQEETGAFLAEKQVTIQANWIFADGTRSATNIKKIDVTENLLNEVIEYDD